MRTSARFVFLVALLVVVPPGCTAETGPTPSLSVARSAESTSAPDSGPSFDRHAALAALRAVDVHPCVAPGNEGAPGHVVVTFRPDGQAASAVIDVGPTEATAAGTCVAVRFQRAAVPSFAGEPVRVGIAFVLR